MSNEDFERRLAAVEAKLDRLEHEWKRQSEGQWLFVTLPGAGEPVCTCQTYSTYLQGRRISGPYVERNPGCPVHYPAKGYDTASWATQAPSADGQCACPPPVLIVGIGGVSKMEQPVNPLCPLHG